MTLLVCLLLSALSGAVFTFIAYRLVFESFFSSFMLIIILIAFFFHYILVDSFVNTISDC